MADYKPSSSPSAPSQTERTRSIFAEDLRIEGNITSEGIVEFGGQLTGDLTADAVVLTSTARVQGRVRARQLTVEGQLQGEVTALQLNIKSSARVNADVAYNLLDIASGAQVEGAFGQASTDKFKL